MRRVFSAGTSQPSAFTPEVFMPRDRLWKPTLRCVRCGRIRPVQALMAWIFQPVTPDGGKVHYECLQCRPPEQRGHGRSGPDLQ
jgi:hypothetical protein